MNLSYFLNYKIGKLIPDRLWIDYRFFRIFKRLPNYSNPKTYNEKLQWLKLNDRDPKYVGMVDKYEAKNYIREHIGDEYVIPTIAGPWDSFDNINFDVLPNEFVLKTTHDCGGVVICKDKDSFNKDDAKVFLNKHLGSNYYYTCREWPYKDVKPRIFAEKYMKDNVLNQVLDYKFFCFDGKPEFMFIASDREDSTEETKFDFFDLNFNNIPVKQGHPNSINIPKRPENFDEMIRIATLLSEGIRHVRIDFYEINGKPYVGEMTFFHFGGFVPFNPSSYDNEFGKYIRI